MALCTDLDGILLTDDLEARAAAESEGIEVHGSIGVVLYAYGYEAISGEEATGLLRALETESSLYLSKPLLSYALRSVEESEGGW
jgi:predicted nucleic acid-binding protein